MRWKPRGSGLIAVAAVLVFGDVGTSWAQATGSVTGTVRSASTRQPVIAAQIQVVGTSQNALTDDAGRYTIANVPSGQQTLRVEVLGFARREAPVTVVAGQAATVDFDLSYSAIALGEIVVTGTPGAQAKRELGNSVSKISVGERLETAPISNATQLLTA